MKVHINVFLKPHNLLERTLHYPSIFAAHISDALPPSPAEHLPCQPCAFRPAPSGTSQCNFRPRDVADNTITHKRGQSRKTYRKHFAQSRNEGYECPLQAVNCRNHSASHLVTFEPNYYSMKASMTVSI